MIVKGGEGAGDFPDTRVKVRLYQADPGQPSGERDLVEFEAEQIYLNQPITLDRLDQSTKLYMGAIKAQVTLMKGDLTGVNSGLLTLKFRRGI